MARKRRSAAQKAATRRLVAANRSRRKPARRKNPIKGSTPRRTAMTRPARTSSRAPVRVTRRRRNPIRSSGKVMDLVRQAGIAASGALALDIAYGYLPIPAELSAGGLKHLVKGAGAIVMGMVAKKVVSAQTANNMTIGALTVILHDAMRSAVSSVAPSIQMDGMQGLGYYSPGAVMGQYLSAPAQMAGLGEYMNQSVDSRANAEYNYYQ